MLRTSAGRRRRRRPGNADAGGRQRLARGPPASDRGLEPGQIRLGVQGLPPELLSSRCAPRWRPAAGGSSRAPIRCRSARPAAERPDEPPCPGDGPAARRADAQLAPLRQRWSALAPRERLLVGAAALVLGLFLLWSVAIAGAAQPVDRAGLAGRGRCAARPDAPPGCRSGRAACAPPVAPPQAEAALQSATQRLGAAARLQASGERITAQFTAIEPAALAALARRGAQRRAGPGGRGPARPQRQWLQRQHRADAGRTALTRPPA